MSVHFGNEEVLSGNEGEDVLPEGEAEAEGEGSLHSINDGEVEESEEVSSSYVSGETDSEDILHTQQGSASVQLDAIFEQSTPPLTADGDDAVAKEEGPDAVPLDSEEQQEEPSQEGIPSSESFKEEDIISEKPDEFEIEYITPIEDPYQKALKYFAKHGILELFGDITALIVLQRPENPYELMVNEISKIHEIELLKGHVTLSERPYVPPNKSPSITSKSGRTSASSDKRDDIPLTESQELLKVQQKGSHELLAERSEGFDLKDEQTLSLTDGDATQDTPETILGLSDDDETVISKDDIIDIDYVESYADVDDEKRLQEGGDHVDTDQEHEEHHRERGKVESVEKDKSAENELVVKERPPDSPVSSIVSPEEVTETEADEHSDVEDPVPGGK